MKSALCTAGYLLLAVSLLVAGVPVHAMMDHEDPDRLALIDTDLDTDFPPESGTGGCPHHAPDTATADSEESVHLSETLAEECCGPDCRCSCAGLSLILMPRFAAPQAPKPKSSRPATIKHLPSLAPAPLLRPPQIS